MLKPSKLSHVEAAAMTMAACVAWGAIRSSKAKAGDHCIVVGASGSIGVMVLQYLRSLGCKVTAVCSGKNAEFVGSKGADTLVDYTGQNFADEAKRFGISYDCVFDCVGGRDIERDGFKVLKQNGVYVTVVGPMRYIGEHKLSWYSLLKVVGYVLKRMLITLFRGPRYRFVGSLPRNSINAALDQAVSHGLRMPIERTIPFQIDAVKSAMRLLTTHRAKGRIVIDFDRLGDDGE
ncbi:MAG: zinc-binding dehydrogenase [Motiliproteus sp.]